jgi:hypothetical protein
VSKSVAGFGGQVTMTAGSRVTSTDLPTDDREYAVR